MEEVDLPIQGRHGDIASLADARERHLVQQERQDLTVFVGAPLVWRGFVGKRENLPANLTAHSSTAAFGLSIPDVGPFSRDRNPMLNASRIRTTGLLGGEIATKTLKLLSDPLVAFHGRILATEDTV